MKIKLPSSAFVQGGELIHGQHSCCEVTSFFVWKWSGKFNRERCLIKVQVPSYCNAAYKYALLLPAEVLKRELCVLLLYALMPSDCSCSVGNIYEINESQLKEVPSLTFQIR